MNKTFYYIGGAVGVVALSLLVWFLFFRSIPTPAPPTTTGNFSTGQNDGAAGAEQNNSGTSEPTNVAANTASAQQVFKIADGPAVSATLYETLHPTTTIARYVMQDSGHVFDIMLDSPGSVPRAVSNTTIPGGQRGLWLGSGAVILQYESSGAVKSVYLGFPPASTSTQTLPVKIQFLPDNIIDIAGSPDNASLVYLLATPGGVAGYLAGPSGLNAKKLFTLPLSQMLLSWPAQKTLLAQSRSAAGVPGIAFSIDAKSGTATSLLYAPGLSAIADRSFSHIIYEKVDAGAVVRSTYLHNVKSGADAGLSFDPFPEKCTWSSAATSTLYCAAPLSYVSANYLDLWRAGAASAADSIFAFDVVTGRSTIIATPGASGGVASDIAQMATSPDGHYLIFVRKGDRSLWGVRLTQ